MSHNRERSILLKGLTPNFTNILTEHNSFVAGGAVVSVFSDKKINDYDVYFYEPSDYEKSVYKFNELVIRKECTIAFKSSNAITYKTTAGTIIQLISFKFGSPLTIFDSFDFTFCMGAYLFKSQQFLLHPEFLQHLSQRRLVYNSSNGYPLSTLFRIKKFIQKRGFFIDAVNLLKVALSIHKLDLSNKAELHRQLSGVSTHALEALMSKLERKPGEPYDFGEIVEWLEEIGDGNTDSPKNLEEVSSIEVEIPF